MNKGGLGVGSASIVLIFSVLCLAIFTLIALTSAQSDMALASAEARLVQAYYEADVLAESVLSEILAAPELPEEALGVEISAWWDMDIGADVAEFSCPISDRKELYVMLALREDSYDILAWRMKDIGSWEIDDSINVWSGFDEDEGFPLWLGD